MKKKEKIKKERKKIRERIKMKNAYNNTHMTK